MAWKLSPEHGMPAIVADPFEHRRIQTPGKNPRSVHPEMPAGWIVERAGFPAQVTICPGEYDMVALAQRGLRFLSNGENMLQHRRRR
jgi:hypothetical protein